MTPKDYTRIEVWKEVLHDFCPLARYLPTNVKKCELSNSIPVEVIVEKLVDLDLVDVMAGEDL